MKYNPVTNTFSGDHHVGLPQVMWHITDVCALTCSFCFSTKSHLATRPEHLELIADRFRELGVLKVDFGGGEPVSYDRFDEAVNLCEQREMHLTVTTSGVISPKSRRWLLANQARFARVIVSIDGTSQIHDRLRGRIGAFKDAIRTLAGLLEQGSNVRVNTVLTTAITHEAMLVLQQALEAAGLPEWCLIQPHPSNAKPTFESHAISDATYRGLVATAQQASRGVSKIVERPLSAYVGYWTLHPQGRMRPQTTEPEDGEGFYLLEVDVEQALREIGKVPIKVPTERLGQAHAE